MQGRVSIVWTETALTSLKTLPKKVRAGLLDKADQLLQGGDPRQVHKPLIGPLQGYFRITYGRYRAIYRVEESSSPHGEKQIVLTVVFVLAGIRKAFDKNDIYHLAQRLAHLLGEQGEAAKPPKPAAKQPKPRRK